MVRTFQQLAQEALNKGTTLRVVPRQAEEEGEVFIYAHPVGMNGTTLDFIVRGNNLIFDGTPLEQEDPAEVEEVREITTHVANDRQPQLLAVGKPGLGGAAQKYAIHYVKEHRPEPEPNLIEEILLPFVSLEEDGVTNEVLLAVVIDRLEGFQAGQYACEENAFTLEHCRLALDTLHSRTRERMNRGVENTDKV